MIDKYVLDYLAQNEGPLAYSVLGLSAMLEYVVPPLPGDTVTLFGILLATSAGYSGLLVYSVLTLGSVLGGLLSYAFGRWIGSNEPDWPAFLRREGTRASIERLEALFRRHGAVYLALNRFFPAFRAVFFLVAGMVRMPVAKVAFFGAISACLWNALLMVIGFAVGHNLDKLLSFSRKYTLASLVVVLVALAIAGALHWQRRRR